LYQQQTYTNKQTMTPTSLCDINRAHRAVDQTAPWDPTTVVTKLTN